jgi:hypothetical protein
MRRRLILALSLLTASLAVNAYLISDNRELRFKHAEGIKAIHASESLRMLTAKRCNSAVTYGDRSPAVTGADNVVIIDGKRVE